MGEQCLTTELAESLLMCSLHTDLTSCPGYLQIDAEALLSGSLPAASWEALARTLTPEDRVIHLCLQGIMSPYSDSVAASPWRRIAWDHRPRFGARQATSSTPEEQSTRSVESRCETVEK
jgi:hypothetical protein